MKTLSIVPADKSVTIDGVGHQFDFAIDIRIHAVTWDGSKNKGVVEYKPGTKEIVSGRRIPLFKKEIKTLQEFQSIIDQFLVLAEAKKAEVDAVLKNNKEEVETYAHKRREAYPAIADQLDMLYHAMTDSEIQVAQEFCNALKTVKEKYPKT